MKTIEEKAQAYTDSTETRVFGCEETLDATELIQKGFIAGAKEALAGQWRSVEDELPKEEDVVVIFTHPYRPFITENTVAYLDGEDWYTVNGELIRPTHWMSIPEPPKEESHV